MYDPKKADHTVGQGKVIKKTPDKAFINNGQFTGNAHGMDRPMEHSHQMMTNENRDTTSVSYYGVKGNQLESQGYVEKGEEGYVHKQQLSDLPVLNLTNQKCLMIILSLTLYLIGFVMNLNSLILKKKMMSFW